MQHRHEQTSKARGRRHFITQTKRKHILKWYSISRHRKHYRRISEAATESHFVSALQRTWSHLHQFLLRDPQNRKKTLCKQIMKQEITIRQEFSRQRRLSSVPRPRLKTTEAVQNERWRDDQYTDTEDMSHVSRIFCPNFACCEIFCSQ